MLKVSNGLRLPELDGLSRFFRWWERNQRRGFFIYGGFREAKPESRQGPQNSGPYGRSPTQSEGIMLEFGDLVIIRNRRNADRWPVLHAASA